MRDSITSSESYILSGLQLGVTQTTHSKETHVKKIELRARNVIIILDSIINIIGGWGGTYMTK